MILILIAGSGTLGRKTLGRRPNPNPNPNPNLNPNPNPNPNPNSNPNPKTLESYALESGPPDCPAYINYIINIHIN